MSVQNTSMRNPNNRSTIAPPRTQLSKQPIDPAQVASEANKCPQESRGSTPTERRNALLETSAFCNAVGNKIIVTVIVALISWLDRTAIGAQGLRIDSIDVPAAAVNGSSVWLACNYELAADEQLYSVKWYRDYVEFYRFQPSSALAQVSDARFEFELKGVNLDLARCNSTHVHLKQVTPATEATYKCEISADAPSFKTVSAERQLKVYILPKRKLTIVNNNNNNNNNVASSNPQQQSQAQQSQHSQYAVNDFINLTCISAHSKPTASLRWLVNDAPADSEWLTLRQFGGQTTTTNNLSSDSFETQLTIAFRIQPNHLSVRGLQTSPKAAQARPRSTWLIQLRCIAQLDVEFVAETSIQLADGKTVKLKNRRQNPPSSHQRSQRLPEPMQLAPAGETTRPSGSFRMRSSGRGSEMLDLGAYKWPPAPSRQEDPLPAGAVGGASLMVWTGRQLRAQSEHIEYLLSRTRPNELETPLIEAALRRTSGSSSSSDLDADFPTASSSGSPIRTRRLEVGDTFAETDSSDSDGDAYESAKEDEDEVFEFTCRPQFQSQERDLIRELRTVWLLNNRQVKGDRVNSFDGALFNYMERSRSNESNGQLDEENNRKTLSPSRQIGSLQRSQMQPASLRSNVHKLTEQIKLKVELSASLLQLKELNLKCRTTLVQPLIEFESQSVALVTTGTQTSGPFIHAIESNVDSGASQVDPTSRYNRRPAGGFHYQRRNSSTNRNNINSDNGSNYNNNRPKQHWTSVIRLRQNPSPSSSAASSTWSTTISIVSPFVVTSLTISAVSASLVSTTVLANNRYPQS